MCSMNTRKSIFFSQTSVRIQLNNTKGVKSQSENRKLQFLGKFIFFTQTLARVQFYKQLGYNTYLKLLRLPLLRGQPSRLTNSFVEYYRFDSLMSQLFKSLGYKIYLKLLKLKIAKFYIIYLMQIYSLLYVLRMASLMLSTVGIIAFSRFCA